MSAQIPEQPSSEIMDSKKFEDILERARIAAQDGRSADLIKDLTLSGYIDGLVRRLSYTWDALPRFEIEICVANAVDSVCEAIAGGRPISNLGGWLWKAAYNKAHDCWSSHYKARLLDDTGFENVGGEYLSETELRNREERQEAKRKEAIRIARSLLPRVGVGKIADVMELILEAVENDIPELTSTELGDALGISPGAARKLLSRGFTRLSRLARKEGIELPEDLSEFENGTEKI